jgi:Tol biopolymer transport system component
MIRLLSILLLCSLTVGCVTTRRLTITSKPADAMIKVDGVDVGKAPVLHEFAFKDDKEIHRVSAAKLGFKEQTFNLTRDFDKETLTIDLKPQTKRINISVSPVPAVVSINGKPASTEAQAAISQELEFTVDPNGRWNTYTISAERTGFLPAQALVRFEDRDPVYVLQLEPMRKEVAINTIPTGADVSIDGEMIGKSPVRRADVPFEYDTTKEQFVARKIKLAKPGYDPYETEIGWDDGKTDYTLNLMAKQKTIRVNSDPSGAVVMLEGKELPREANGASTIKLEFPPTNDKGELRTYKLIVTKKTDQSEWYPQEILVGWDNGKSDYSVNLREIKTMPVNLLTWQMSRADNGWEVLPKVVQTIAAKDTSEGSGKEPPLLLTQMPKGTMIDTLTLSPDGKTVLFTVLYGRDRKDFRSQIYTIKTDGTGGAAVLTDGKSLELMPSYSPDGKRIVFSSDRAGKRLSIWSIDANGAPGIVNLTSGETNDLWPSLDSDAKQRLFYQSLIDTRPDPRIFMIQLGTAFRTDLSQSGGMQPRISPRNDVVIFSSINEKTGKRDIFKMDAKGGLPQNLTNTPDVDEYDAVWNRDGSKLAYVCDRGVDEEKRQNADIWVIDLARTDQPTQVTTNASQDECPAWDLSDNAIYFRSNRGGDWGIWRVGVR